MMVRASPEAVLALLEWTGTDLGMMIWPPLPEIGLRSSNAANSFFEVLFIWM